MTQYFFSCSGGQTYYGDNSRYDRNDRNGAYVAGWNQGEQWAGNRKALIFFNSTAIRSTLAGKKVTSCLLDFYVKNIFYDTIGGTAVFGIHNYTAIPDVWNSSRVQTNMVQRDDTFVGQIRNFSLGTTIGTAFKDGVATGLTLGPGPSNSNFYFMEIAPSNDQRRPVLIIDAEVSNAPPGAPTLVEPVSGAVIDAATLGVSFKWNVNDTGDVQTGYRLQRRRPNTASPGNFITEWWNGTDFVATETSLPGANNAGALNSNGALVIPSDKFTNGIRWEWSVATRDSLNQWGSYAPLRPFYASTPPVTTVTPFEGGRAKTPRPTIRWAFSDADGDAQRAWSLQIVEPAVYTAPGFVIEDYLGATWQTSATVDIPAQASSATATAAQVNLDLRNHKTYRAYVKTSSSPAGASGFQFSPWNYTQFDIVVPPSAPTLLYPANGSVADLGSGFTMEWRNNYFSNVGSQTAYSIRRQVEGNSDYQYWSGSSWVTVVEDEAPPFLQGASSTYSFRKDEVTNGQSYVFSVAIRDDYNEVSPYSSGSTVEGSTAATVEVVAPSGTSNVTNPTVTWTMYDIENDPQQNWQVRIIHSSVYSGEGSSWDPGAANAVWDSGQVLEEGTRNVELPVNLDNGETYKAYVRVATNGIYSGWASSEFTISIVPPATPTSYTEVLDDLGAIAIHIQGRDSMLNEDASRCFGDWADWDRGADDNSNSTVDNAITFESSQSRYATRVTATAANKAALAHTETLWPVAPGMTYTAAATLIAAFGSAPVGAYISMEFFNADQELIQVTSTQPISDETAVRSTHTAIAPEAAAYVGLRITFQNVPAAGAQHLFFDPVLRPTTGSEWSPGGTLTNTFASVTETSEDRLIRYGQNVPIPVETQQVTIIDEEARMGLDMTYAVTIRTIYVNAALVTAPQSLPAVRWVSGYLWLSDPLRRGSGRYFHPQAFEEVTRPVRQGTFRPIGRPDAIVTTGVRGLQESSFTIVTHSREEREVFTALSDKSEIILLRIPPDNADPTIADSQGETLYVKFIDNAPEKRPLQQRTPHRTITQAWVEQRTPAVGYDYVAPEEGVN
jgi:hypothetical protein